MTDNNNNTYESTPLLQSQKHTHPWYSIDNDNYSTSSNLVYNNNNKSLLQRVKSYITYSSNNNVLLTIYLLSSIVVAVANNITWKSTLDRFKSIDNTSNLEFFVNQWTVFLYVVLAAIILLYRLIKQQISNQQRNFATQKFAFMGLLDAAAGVFSAIGCSFTSGTVQTLCNQGAIPATMFMSRLFLQQYYSKLQYCGAILIVIGALSAALPASMMSGSDSNQTTTLGLLVLLASIIPSSFSNVYKEHNFKSQNLDVYYLTVYVSIFQVLLGFLFVPILSIKGLGGISLSSVPYNFIDGWNCFLGRYVQNYECHLYQPPYIPLLLYVIVNFAYNTLLLLITKHGSALLLVISSALALPLTNLLFTQSYFMVCNYIIYSYCYNYITNNYTVTDDTNLNNTILF